MFFNFIIIITIIIMYYYYYFYKTRHLLKNRKAKTDTIQRRMTF